MSEMNHNDQVFGDEDRIEFVCDMMLDTDGYFTISHPGTERQWHNNPVEAWFRRTGKEIETTSYYYLRGVRMIIERVESQDDDNT